MTEELVERLTADFQRAYFVTGGRTTRRCSSSQSHVPLSESGTGAISLSWCCFCRTIAYADVDAHQQRAVTCPVAVLAGFIDDSIYEPNCTFVDATVKFSGWYHAVTCTEALGRDHDSGFSMTTIDRCLQVAQLSYDNKAAAVLLQLAV